MRFAKVNALRICILREDHFLAHRGKTRKTPCRSSFQPRPMEELAVQPRADNASMMSAITKIQHCYLQRSPSGNSSRDYRSAGAFQKGYRKPLDQATPAARSTRRQHGMQRLADTAAQSCATLLTSEDDTHSSIRSLGKNAVSSSKLRVNETPTLASRAPIASRSTTFRTFTPTASAAKLIVATRLHGVPTSTTVRVQYTGHTCHDMIRRLSHSVLQCESWEDMCI